MNINEKIKNLREKRQLTQVQFAKAAGIAVITLQQYESGKRIPATKQLIKIANAFEMPLDYFTTGWEDKLNNPQQWLTNKEERIAKNDELSLLNEYRILSPEQKYSIRQNVQNFINSTSSSVPDTIIVDTNIDINHPYNILMKKIEDGEQLTPEESTYLAQYTKEALESVTQAVKRFGETIEKYFSLLNEEGQEKAAEQISRTIEQLELLSKVPQYQKNPDENK